MQGLARSVGKHPSAFAGAVMLVACSLPTGDVCGCPPAVSSVIVAGRAQDAVRTPVRVEFSALQATRTDTAWSRSELVSGAVVLSDGLGQFRTRLLTPSGPGLYLLRLRIVRAPMGDTTTVALGSVRFAMQGQPPDSTFVTVIIP